MNKSIILVVSFFLISTAKAEIKFSYECETIGTNITGEKKVKVKELFSYSESSTKSSDEKEKWKITDAKFFSDGKKYDSKLTSYDSKYALYTYATQDGKGFNVKVNSFQFFIDFTALSIERVVTSFPQGNEERVRGTCKKVPIK